MLNKEGEIMKKTNRNLLMLILSLVMAVSFSAGIFAVGGAETTDVRFAFSDVADFAKSSEMIENETVDVFGCNGWGGMVKVLTLDKDYDVSGVTASEDAAFTFYLYIGDKTTLENQQGAAHWNVDICSDLNYNDTNKYSFNLAADDKIFSNCKIGWNKIVVPVSTAQEKNSVNWATIRTIRLNTNSPAAGNVLKFANFGFTTSTVSERHVLKVGVNELETVEFKAASLVNVLDNGNDISKMEKKFAYYNGTSVEKKPCYFFKDWGGYVALMNLDKAYDASAYAEGATLKNPNAALSFYIFFKTEDCLAHYKTVSQFNFDVSSGAPQADGSYVYSDSYKWSFNVSKAFEQCRVGWNKVIIPLSKHDVEAGNANMDWSNVRFIRINATGVGGVATRVGVGGLSLCTTEYTEITVLDEERCIFPTVKKANMTGTDFNLADFVRDGEVVTTYIKPHTSAWWTTLAYKTPIDLSHYTAAEKAFDKNIASLNKDAPIEEYATLELSVYFPDEENLNHYKACSGFNIDVSSGEAQADGSYVYSDNYKYSFNFGKLFEKCSVGWNRLLIPFCTHDVEAGNANMDWANVRFVRFNAHGDPGGKHPVTNKGFRIGFADIGVCFSTLTEMTVEGWVEPTEEEVVKNEKVYCDGGTGFHIAGFETAFGDATVISDAGYYKEGTGAAKFYGQGTGSSGFKFEKSVDLSMYDKLSLWLYVDDAANLAAIADGQIELTSAGRRDDANEYSWQIKSLSLKDGWNWVVLDLASAKTGAPDITKIDYFNIYFVGVPKIGTLILDDLHAHTSNGVAIETFDNGFMGQVQVIEGKVDNATNMTSQGWIARKKYAESVNIADADTIALWVRCDDEYTCKNIAGTEIEITSAGTADTNEIAFFLPDDLVVGWNYVTWKISEGRAHGGEIDLTAVNFVGIVKVGIPEVVTCFFDDLRAYDSRMAPEVVEPIEKEVIINADKITSNIFEGMTIDDVEYKEGFAALSHTTEGTEDKVVFKAQFNPVVTGLSLVGEHELGYAFWFYVDDVANLTNLNVELSSQPKANKFELDWTIKAADLQSGWNWITLKASDAKRPDGVIDLNNIIRTRLVVKGTAAMTIKLDCFAIVDSTLDGAFTPIEDKVTLNPVDNVVVDNCEAAWRYSDKAAEVNEVEKMEGYASAEITGVGTAQIFSDVNVGKTELLVNPYRSNNELGVGFWLYVEDVDTINEVNFALLNEIAGTNAVSWAVNTLNDGWNYVTAGVSTATINGIFDADNIKHVRVSVIGKDNENFKVLIDRVRVINYAVEANRAEPEYEGIDRNPISSKVIIDCNTVSGTIFTGNRVDKNDYRYGTGCVYTSGYGYALSATDLEIGKTDLTKKTFVMGLWVWIENVELFDVDAFNTQIEIGSTNKYDEYEIAWENWTEGLVNGWNWVVLEGKNAIVSGNLPDFDNLCRFRLYINGVDLSTLKIDRITIGSIYDETIYQVPDWENEILGGENGIYGSNNYAPENSTYIEVDFATEAEDYVAVDMYAIEGCSGSVTAQLPVYFLLVIAGICVFVKKRRQANKN